MKNGKMTYSKSKTCVFLYFTQIIVTILLVRTGIRLTIKQMAIMAIVYCALNLLLFKYGLDIDFISLPNLFCTLVLLFNCGQLIMCGFGIDGSIPLPFQQYGNCIVVQKSFFFFLLGQLFYSLAISIANTNTKCMYSMVSGTRGSENTIAIFKSFILLGLIPRIYIDGRSLITCMHKGYAGVYNLYFPQYFQTLAFFFDVGLILALFYLEGEHRKKRMLFLFVLTYKCLMMLSGSRQDKVAFLLMWIYLYFFILSNKNAVKILLLIVSGILGLALLSVITYTRAGGLISLSGIISYLRYNLMGHILGNVLGEFGATFDTLEIAMNFVPEVVPYGLGKSYLCGLLSIIPLLVAHVPFLSDYSVFLQLIPSRVTYAMGGSFLGELYFNFSWIGVLGCAVIGFIIYRAQFRILDKNSSLVQKTWNTIVLIELILFIRGYFTDMVQKLAWTYILLKFCEWYFSKKKN